jgi:kynurenine formamidase
MLDPDAARYLMETFPNLRAVAIDAASIGAPEKEQPTIDTHQILTGKGREDGRYLLIFEDLRIDSDLGDANRIYAWPLFIVGSDGSPCTIVAEFAD